MSRTELEATDGKKYWNGLALMEKWLRNKNTIEFLAIWEQIYNQDFNSSEFEGIKNQAGLIKL